MIPFKLLESNSYKGRNKNLLGQIKIFIAFLFFMRKHEIANNFYVGVLPLR